MKKYIGFHLLCIAFFGLFNSCKNSETPIESAQERYPMLKPCTPEGLKETILCGTIQVFEDQETQSGKKIPLNVYLFPTTNKSPSNSVFVDYTGGPGRSNEMYLDYYEKGAFSYFFREVRDVLIVDKRGTGASRIPCQAMDTISLNLDYYLYDPKLLHDCLQEVKDKVDLSKYNTASQVEDLETIRTWLNIDQIDFHGQSYGTRVGLEYIRKYPNSIRSAILTGSVPPEFGLFGFKAFEIERVLKKLILRCESDSICQTNFPHFKEELYRLRNDLKDNPVNFTFRSKSNRNYELLISDTVFLEFVASIFSGGTNLEKLPYLIHEASTGNFHPLIEVNISSLPKFMPLHLSQFCPEESSRFDDAKFTSMDSLYSKGVSVKKTFKACNAWAEIPTPEWVSEPIGGNTPLLLFSGEDDVLTPPRMNNYIENYFPNSQHIVFKDQGHSFTDWSCWDKLVYQFLKSNAQEELDTSCVAKIIRLNFAIEE